MLLLLFLALWLILRGDLYCLVLSCVSSLCFALLLALRSPRLGEERADLCAFRAFVCFARVGLCLSHLPLGVRDWLRLVFVAHTGLFFLHFFHTKYAKHHTTHFMVCPHYSILYVQILALKELIKIAADSHACFNYCLRENKTWHFMGIVC